METSTAACRLGTLRALRTVGVGLNTSRRNRSSNPERELSHHGRAFMHVWGVRGQKRVTNRHICRIASNESQTRVWHKKVSKRSEGRLQAADEIFTKESALQERLVGLKALSEAVPTATGSETSAAIPEPTNLQPANVPQRLLSLALSLTLVLGSLSGVQAAHAEVAGLQDGVSTLLDASKEISDGQGGAENVAAKAAEVEDRASAAINSAKEKLDKVQKGAAILVEGAKDGPGGEEEAKQVAQKAEELTQRTSDEVAATLKSAEKMKEGAKLLAEAAGVDTPGVGGRASESSGQSNRASAQESSSTEKQSDGEKNQSKRSGSDSGDAPQKQGFQGFFSAIQDKFDGAKEGFSKLPSAINRGSGGAVKEEAPAGVESGIKKAVKEGVSGSVKEGLTGAVTGGVGGGVAGAASGAAKGAIAGATGK